MRATPVDLIGGYYADDTLPWSCQDTVNYLPVMAEIAGTRTPKYLKTPPGLKPYKQVGSGPIRGMHDCEGARFVVSGQTLCRINPNGSISPLGTIPGVGRVTMTHNQFKTGNQLLVENGQGGGGYVYDTSAGTFAKITDEGYPGSISSDYLDSYMLGVEPQGRYWFHSNLADATDYNTFDRYESEASPDRIVGLITTQFEVVVFNETTTEFFYNTGAATGTFQSRRQMIERGCASRHSIAKLDNSPIWLGDDGIVYRLDGYRALPISTGPMHRAFAGLNWSEAFAFTWEDQGFKVYYLTFPDGHTWGYDVVSQIWTRRESFGLDRWRLSHMVKWGRTWYGGDFQSGRLWEIDWDYLLEGDDEFISRRVSPVLADNQSQVGIPFAELIFDTGQGPATTAIAFPTSVSITGTPPAALVGLAYPIFSFGAVGGTAPYAFSITEGSLPAGLALSSAGAITGTATAVGTSNFTVRVYDANLNWTEGRYSILSRSGVLALAIPEMLYAGSYESLVPLAPITNRVPSIEAAFSVSPNAGYAYVGLTATPFGVLCKYNPDTGTFAESASISFVPAQSVRCSHFSPDGLHLALVTGTGAAAGTLRVLKLEAGVWNEKSTAVLGTFCESVTFSPNGSRIVVSQTATAPNLGCRIYEFNKTTSALGAFIYGGGTPNAQSPTGFGWSPDGRFLAEWSNNTLKVRSTTGASALVVSTGTLLSGRGAHFSADGKFVYTLGSPTDRRIAAYPVNEGVLGTAVVYPSLIPATGFSPSDSAMSGDYMAVVRIGNATPAAPPVMLFKASGTTVELANVQPAFTSAGSIGAIAWTL